MKAVEEWTGIELRGALELPGLDRRGKIPNIAGNHLRVETQRISAEEKLVRSQLAAQRVQCLVEQVPRALVSLWPEIRQELVARHAEIGRHCEQRQKSEAPPLRCRATDRNLIALQGGGPERPQSQHRQRIDSTLRS